MRASILTYLKDLKLRNYQVVDQLPFDNGVPLYISNKKNIYVDAEQITQTPIFDTFDSLGSVDEVTTISVYFTTDAKRIASDYDDIARQLMGARTAPGTEGFVQKLANLKTSYDTDNLITEIEFSFKRLLTN
jgi:hypothetical protein